MNNKFQVEYAFYIAHKAVGSSFRINGRNEKVCKYLFIQSVVKLKKGRVRILHFCHLTANVPNKNHQKLFIKTFFILFIFVFNKDTVMS